jgi:hypothetical protein
VWITQPLDDASVTGTSWVTLWLDGATGTSRPTPDSPVSQAAEKLTGRAAC